MGATDVIYRPATSEDIAYISEHIREEDKAEVLAGSGLTPWALLTLYDTFCKSDGWMLVGCPAANLPPVCIFGCSRLGELWLLGTKELENYTVTIIKESRKMLRSFHKIHPVLKACVDSRNSGHLRYLERGLKFKRIRTDTCGYDRNVQFITLEHYRA